MKVIFKRPKLFTGYTEEVDLDCIPRIGDNVVLQGYDDLPCRVSGVEWYPFGDMNENDKVVYITTIEL